MSSENPFSFRLLETITSILKLHIETDLFFRISFGIIIDRFKVESSTGTVFRRSGNNDD